MELFINYLLNRVIVGDLPTISGEILASKSNWNKASVNDLSSTHEDYKIRRKT